jgi:hypothetical protein
MTDADIEIERVPPGERGPERRFQVVIGVSVFSRHATPRQAKERAREAADQNLDKRRAVAEQAIEAAKIGSPVDATLDPMDETGMDRFAAGGGRRGELTPEEQSPEERSGSTFSSPPGFTFFTTDDSNGGESDEENDGDDLTFDDPLGVGGGDR